MKRARVKGSCREIAERIGVSKSCVQRAKRRALSVPMTGHPARGHLRASVWLPADVLDRARYNAAREGVRLAEWLRRVVAEHG